MSGKKITKVVTFCLGAADRVSDRSRPQKWTFWTILNHFLKKFSKIGHKFLVEIDSQSWTLDILEVGEISRKSRSEQVKSRPSE